MSSDPERQLRRAITDLAKHDAADLQLILEEFEPQQRRRVQHLLRKLTLTGTPNDYTVPPRPQVSDWLLARVSGSVDGMTAHARSLLAMEIEALASKPPPFPLSVVKRPTLLRRGLIALRMGTSR